MLALPKSDAAADTRVCIGTITTTAIARAGTPNGLLFVRAKTQASDLLVTDPACVSGGVRWSMTTAAHRRFACAPSPGSLTMKG